MYDGGVCVDVGLGAQIWDCIKWLYACIWVLVYRAVFSVLTWMVWRCVDVCVWLCIWIFAVITICIMLVCRHLYIWMRGCVYVYRCRYYVCEHTCRWFCVCVYGGCVWTCGCGCGFLCCVLTLAVVFRSTC